MLHACLKSTLHVTKQLKRKTGVDELLCKTRNQSAAAEAKLTSELELRMKQVVFLRLTLPTSREVKKREKDLTWQPSLPPNSSVLAITCETG